MPTINVKLPKTLTEFVESKARSGDFATAEEFVRSLIRDAHRRDATSRLEQLVIDGIESGPGVEATPGFWEKLKDDVRKGTQGKLKPKRSSRSGK